MKVLSNEAAVKVGGKWRTLRAILVSSQGGQRVVYLDKDGCEVLSEALSKSQFKNIHIEEE